jgi:hypothetical protein
MKYIISSLIVCATMIIFAVDANAVVWARGSIAWDVRDRTAL